MSMGDCDTEVGPVTPVRDTEEMALMVDLAKLAAEAGVTNDLGFRAFMREVVGDHDADQASDAWVLAGGTRMAPASKPSTGKARIPSEPSTVGREMTPELGFDALGATKETADIIARESRLTSDEAKRRLGEGSDDPKDAPAETISLGLGDAGENFGERTVFNWDWADGTGKLIRDTYQTPGSKGRDPKTKENLAYYGGYIYERLSRMNGKRPKIDTWAAYMKASTGHDIAPQDLLDAWETMRQTAWKTRVQKEVDIRNAAMKRAGSLLNPDQLKEFVEQTKAIDATDKDAHKKFREALDKLRKDDPMSLVWELPGLRRAIRTSLDLSAAFMQGSIYTLDPFNLPNTKTNMAAMFKAFANDEYAKAVMHDLNNREAATEIQKFAPGLLSKFGADVDITSHEEAYATRVFDAVAEASFENRPYQAFNPVQAMPSIMAATVGLPLTVTAGPLVGIPAALLAGKATSLVVNKLSPKGSGLVQTAPSVSAEKLGKLSAMMQKAFEYQPKEGEAIETWDKRVSRELGILALPKSGVAGAGASMFRQGARDLRASERSYVVYLNLQRMQAWERVTKQMKALGINPDTHPEASQALGRVIGTLTGRADMGKVEDAGKWLSYVFFSPRFQWSTVQALYTTPAKTIASIAVDKLGSEKTQEAYKGAAGGRFYMPPEVRKEFVGAMAKALAGLSVILGLAVAGGAALYLDPRHKDFMKARFRNITLDFSGGKANWLRLIAQTMLFQEKQSNYKKVYQPGVHLPGDTSGVKTQKLTGQGMNPTPREVFMQSIEGKENPIIGDIFQLQTGRDVFGSPVYRGRFDKASGPDFGDSEAWSGVSKDIWKNFGPLSVVDLLESMNAEDREGKEQLLALLAALGVNVKANELKKP